MWIALASQELAMQPRAGITDMQDMRGHEMFSSWARLNRHIELGFYASWHCWLVAERIFDPATCTPALTYFDSPSVLPHVLYTPCDISPYYHQVHDHYCFA